MNRKEQRQLWLSEYFKHQPFTVAPASADASFRSYFRVSTSDKSLVLMDAPPQHEDCRPFIQVLEILHQHQIHVPALHASDLQQGFLLLDDLGTVLYLDQLNDKTVDSLYLPAIDAIIKMQSIDVQGKLPAYDDKLLMTEMQLFTDWFIAHHLGIELKPDQENLLNTTYTKFKQNAIEQPQVMVHRDYHSRNLMITENNSPGVIDFQDAVFGPFTYDLASLLKDCYISWPESTIERYCAHFLQQHNELNECQISADQFMRWFDLMGAQRHLKAIGIFCRLNYRDSKPGYLNDIPRTMAYLMNVTEKYPELKDFGQLLQDLQPKVVKTG